MEKECHLYHSDNDFTLYQGKMQEVLSTFEKASIDSIVCDPPYELNFMGKGWDNQGIAFQPDTWKHCYDVLKPGGYLLAFGGSRTFHRIACAIEDAGFEIRDCIMWLYGSGFPKSQNIGLAIDKKNGVSSRAYQSEETTTSGSYEIKQAQNEWQGWGTCLKPAYEPIIVARKPFKGSLVDNVLAYGVGGLNIDECRVNNTDADTYDLEKRKVSKATGSDNDGHFLDLLHNKDLKHGVTNLGRFPANVIHDGSDEVCAGMPYTKSNEEKPNQQHTFKGNKEAFQYGYKMRFGSGFDDEGSASRYFYCAKASKKDRDEGLDTFEEKQVYGSDMNWGYGNNNGDNFGERIANVKRKNIHPTVKPVELMQYLVRLVSPKGSIVLDCFMGSGSTGKAVMFENRERDANYHFIGIEMTEEYLPICRARIDYAKNQFKYQEMEETKVIKEQGITTIFDFL